MSVKCYTGLQGMVCVAPKQTSNLDVIYMSVLKAVK